MEPFDAFLVLIALSVLVGVVYHFGRNHLVRRKVRCPQTGCEYDVGLVERYDEPHEPVRIDSCARFEDPHKVDCPQGCLRQLR